MTATETTPLSAAVRAKSPDSADSAPSKRNGAGRWVRKALREPAYVLSWLVITVIVLWVVVPRAFTSSDPLAPDPDAILQPPSLRHVFGTDYIGRDLFSRVVHGTTLSLQATLIALALAFVVSAVVGLVAGSVGGAVDAVLMRLIDVLLSVPGLLISLILVTALGFGTVNIAIAVAAGSIASFSRVMRAEVLRVSTSPFVEAARAAGVRWYRVLLEHVLPHARGSVLSLIALEFGQAILSIAALSFLGFGVALPAPEWGNLVAEGRSYLATAPWMTFLPGAVIVVVVLAANRISRGIGHRKDGYR